MIACAKPGCDEMATSLGICTATVKQWGHHGLLRRHRYSDKNECLYEPPGDAPPTLCCNASPNICSDIA